jgi:hypothetical protein
LDLCGSSSMSTNDLPATTFLPMGDAGSNGTQTGNSTATKKLRKKPAIPKRVPHTFLCRLGIRHWCRIASTTQKVELVLALCCSIGALAYHFSGSQRPARSTTQNMNEAITAKAQVTGAKSALSQPVQKAPEAHSSLLSMAGEAFKKTEHFFEEELKGVHQPHIGFNEMKVFGPDYDKRTDLSPEEWSTLRKLTSSFPAGAKIAIAWPTIPVPYKGSDSRAVDAIRVLSEAGFSVDLIFWRDFASEIHSDAHDDTPERQRITEAGVNRILGPYEDTPLSLSHTFVSSYHAMVYWLWPHIEWLDALTDMITHVASMNGMTKLIAAADDAGVSARLLQGAFAQSDHKVTMDQVFDYIYYNRPSSLLGGQDLQKTLTGSASLLSDGHSKPSNFDNDKWNYAKVLLQQEMNIYTQSDVLVGINDATISFLKKVRVLLLLGKRPFESSLFLINSFSLTN